MDELQFLHSVAQQLGVESEQAKKIVSAVFHELHDRLTAKEAADVASQLPTGLKQMWLSFDFPGREVKRTHKAQFIRGVAEAAEISELDASRAMTIVFRLVQLALKSPTGEEGEAWDIFSQLPKDLKKVWLAAARPQAAGRL